MVLKGEIEKIIKKLKHPHSLSKHEVWRLLGDLNIKISTLHHIAMHDEKTGLHNMAFFKKVFAIEVAQALRGKPLSVIITDIDNFKDINDEKGHVFADMLLKKIGTVMLKELRSYDIIARYGGDEFLIMLPDSSSESAKLIAERLRRAILEDKILSQNSMKLSFGVASFQAKDSFNSLIERADKALYRAKREGKDRICCW